MTEIFTARFDVQICDNVASRDRTVGQREHQDVFSIHTSPFMVELEPSYRVHPNPRSQQCSRSDKHEPHHLHHMLPTGNLPIRHPMFPYAPSLIKPVCQTPFPSSTISRKHTHITPESNPSTAYPLAQHPHTSHNAARSTTVSIGSPTYISGTKNTLKYPFPPANQSQSTVLFDNLAPA